LRHTVEQSRQIRLTYEDTIDSQEKFRTFVWDKARTNDFVRIKERKEYIKLLNKAFLSNGNWRFAFYIHDNMKIPLGPVHTFSLKLAYIHTQRVRLQRYEVVLDVDIKDLWSILIEEMPFIFVGALEEALKISGENLKAEERESFEWKHEKGFDE